MTNKIHKSLKKLFIIGFALISSQLLGQNGLNFDGTDDRVSCGNDTSLQITGKLLTLEAWVYPTSFKTDPWDCNVVCKEDQTKTNNGYMLRVGGTGQLNFAMGNGTSTWAERNSPNNVLVLNKWQHIAGTYDGKRMRLYVDGNAIDSMDIATSITNTALTINLTIGDHTGTYQRRFQGIIDEVRIWKACRTTAELRAYMNDEFCSYQKGLRAYYKFNHGKASGSNSSVTSLTDYSGFKNNGTLQNFALSGSSSNWVTGKSMKRASTLSTLTITACDRYTSASGKFKWATSGTYYDTIQTTMSCDSVLKYVLTIKKKTTSSLKAFDCKSFKSPSGLYTWTKTGTYVDYLTNSVGCDSLVTVYLKIGAPMDSVSLSNCYKVTSPSSKKTYTQSGRYFDTLVSYRGCDSVVIVKATIFNGTSSEVNAATCRRYFSPTGKVYKTPGTYYDTLVNYLGCDSIIKTNFSIIAGRRTIIRSACAEFKSPSGNYIWKKSGDYLDTLVNYQGCDSIVTVKLTIWEPGRDTINTSVCRSYILPNSKKLIDKSGVYYEVLKNWKGCDSIITYILTVKMVDDYVVHSGSLLTARNTNAQYQWLNCSQGYKIIDGATARSYIAPANLIYAVELTEAGCKDTSDCVQVVNASSAAVNFEEIAFVPNPSNGHFELRLNYTGSIHVVVTNTMGKVVYEAYTSKAILGPIELNVKSGMYHVRVEGEDFSITKPLVIQP